VREQVAQLLAASDDAAGLLTGPPTGSPTVDRQRQKAHDYAVAKAKSLNLLLMMLDRDEIPTVEAWRTWADARRAADRLWGELVRR
jgi:hypothetical protein